jgi:hypothetical protein
MRAETPADYSGRGAQGKNYSTDLSGGVTGWPSCAAPVIAANMTREVLQALMRHKSSLTTERYVKSARQVSPALAKPHTYLP